MNRQIYIPLHQEYFKERHQEYSLEILPTLKLCFAKRKEYDLIIYALVKHIRKVTGPVSFNSPEMGSSNSLKLLVLFLCLTQLHDFKVNIVSW